MSPSTIAGEQFTAPDRAILVELLDLAEVPIIATDTGGRIIHVNRWAAALFGYAREELLGELIASLIPAELRQRHTRLLASFAAGPEARLRMSSRRDILGCRKDGSRVPLEISIAKFGPECPWPLIAVLRDVSQRKHIEEELVWRATHDVMTGLPNRAVFVERLFRALERGRRVELGVAVLFLDLDGFKLINDTYGHEAGDVLLKEVAARLREAVRPEDTVARFAGDEFVVLCENVATPEALAALADRLLESVRRPVTLPETSVRVSASIGVAVGHGAHQSPQDMLQSADMAMYAAKERGRDGWKFFSTTLQEQARARMTVTQGLPLAIERDELRICFQPIVDATTADVVGAEMLLRWYPQSGEVPPDTFIPLAEASGAILPIGYWVFKQACMAERKWRGRWGRRAPYVSVNLSARQLEAPHIVEQLRQLIDETGASPERMLLEITETALMQNLDTDSQVLARLSAMGFVVAVDDFGTGYSSLSRLTQLPVSTLKIDRSFIAGILNRTEDMAVACAVVGLGKALGLTLVAEGVEMPAQAAELRALGCDFLQGFLFGRPMDDEAFCALFEGSRDAGERFDG